jgi:tRNA (mo5U34)-methyltransferase
VTVHNPAEIELKIRELGPWFHQIEVVPGLWTRTIAPAPGPQPKDHPRSRWRILEKAIPRDLTGMRVLDIGCADGFFALEMAKRGAEVTAIDAGPKMIHRLNWLIAELGITRIKTRIATIESLEKSKEKFDFVLMIALLYHLRHPLLGLDIMARMTDTLYVESVLHETDEDSYMFLQPPIEGIHRIPKWIPTQKCVVDMLRFAGFSKVQILERARANRGIYLAQTG